jgi:hypothetical protein
MSLKDDVLSMTQPGEKFVEVSPFCAMRLMPDGSAMLYKNDLFNDGRLVSMILSRHDLEFIKGMALPVRQFTPGV